MPAAPHHPPHGSGQGRTEPPGRDYCYYGYRLRSILPLESLPPLPPGGSADVILEHGDVPPVLNPLRWENRFFQVDTLGRGLVTLGGSLRFLVTGGRTLRINDATPDARRDMETLLQGAVAGVVLHQRGVLALHASCVAEQGRAVAISGASGQGKSTLAAALAAQGLSLLSDDVTRIDTTAVTMLAFPGPSRVRLWPDAAKALNHTPESLQTGRTGHPKRLLVLPPAPGPVPLTALLRLSIDTGLKRPTLTRLTGKASLLPLEDLVYRLHLSHQLGRSGEIFQALTSLISRVPVYNLARTGDVRDLPELTALVRQVLADDTAQ